MTSTTPADRSPEPGYASGSTSSPSSSLLDNLRQEIARHTPFAQMAAADLCYFLTQTQQQYFAPDEVLVEPGQGVVKQLFYIRRGAVTGTRGPAGQVGGAFEYQTGDLFPLSAALAGRAVTATYRATADTFVLILPLAALQTLARRSPVFADFLTQRSSQFLALSQKALLATYAAQAMNEHSLEKRLGELQLKTPVSCAPETPLREALQTMHQQRIGSMLVTGPTGQPVGILTRYDILGKVTLAQLALTTPMSEVMVQPVLSLSTEHTAQDAALLMSRHGIRHVPVTRGGVAVGMVSERDLFAMQKQSLKNVSVTLRAATDTTSLALAAQGIRTLARSLLGQGVQARQLSTMISHLNDVLTEQLLKIKAKEHGIALDRLCWLALGSEGRNEQTISTDQDNALIIPNDTPQTEREQIRIFAHDVNLALDACGYPLCHGGVMAGQAACCLTLNEWRARFGHWIAQGSPHDLLNASIYFDLRCLAGDAGLAQDLRSQVLASAQQTPRFLKQMAVNALTRSVALNWRGALDTDDQGMIDLKLRGTAIFVDVARLYSLALGIQYTNTRQRLEAVGQQLQLAAKEHGAWVSGFEFLQMLRLRIQLEAGASLSAPNQIKVDSLNDIDQRILRESLRVARLLQQRMQLDYER